MSNQLPLNPRALDQFPGLDEPNRRVNLLIEHLGLTPDEATAYVAGDQSALRSAASRRLRIADSTTSSDDIEAESRP